MDTEAPYFALPMEGFEALSLLGAEADERYRNCRNKHIELTGVEILQALKRLKEVTSPLTQKSRQRKINSP